MSVSVSVHQVCDRCNREFTEKHLQYGESLPELKRLEKKLVVKRGDVVLMSFDDLCPDCDSAVENILKRLRLDQPTKGKRKPAETEAAPPEGNGKGEAAPEAPAAPPAEPPKPQVADEDLF